MTNVSIIVQNLAWVIMFNPFTWIIRISLHGSKCDSSKKLLQVFSLSTILSVLTLFVLEQSLCLVILRDHYTQLVWMIISLLLLCMTFLSLISHTFSSSTFLPLWFLFMWSPPLSLPPLLSSSAPPPLPETLPCVMLFPLPPLPDSLLSISFFSSLLYQASISLFSYIFLFSAPPLLNMNRFLLLWPACHSRH